MIKNVLNKTKVINANLVSQEVYQEVLDYLSKTNNDVLFSSNIHGLYHSEKVVLLSSLIADLEGVSSEDKHILKDAAFYHDIGRESDDEDKIHGLVAANKLKKNMFLLSDDDYERHGLIKLLNKFSIKLLNKENTKDVENLILEASNIDLDKLKGKIIDTDGMVIFLKESIYKDDKNIGLLMAIIDAHSSSNEEIILKNYVEEDSSVRLKYDKLYKILKDADALDRTRFPKCFDYSLNVDMLRYENSKKLVEFSELINDMYHICHGEYLDEKYLEDQESVKIGEMPCYHGIGYDFIKFKSILKHGILSYVELIDKGLKGARNFNGGNSISWISLVGTDATLYDQDKLSAYDSFIKDSISFECELEVYKGFPKQCKDEAIEMGIPYEHSNYYDEVYAKSKISIDEITKIRVPINNKKLSEINFMPMTTSSAIFKERMNYYKDEISLDEDFVEVMLKRFDDYKKELEYIYSCSQGKKSDVLNKTADMTLAKIKNLNKVIDLTVAQKYECLYKGLIDSEDEILIEDIIVYELNENGYDYRLSYNSDFMIIEGLNNVRDKTTKVKSKKGNF